MASMSTRGKRAAAASIEDGAPRYTPAAKRTCQEVRKTGMKSFFKEESGTGDFVYKNVRITSGESFLSGGKKYTRALVAVDLNSDVTGALMPTLEARKKHGYFTLQEKLREASVLLDGRSMLPQFAYLFKLKEGALDEDNSEDTESFRNGSQARIFIARDLMPPRLQEAVEGLLALREFEPEKCGTFVDLEREGSSTLVPSMLVKCDAVTVEDVKSAVWNASKAGKSVWLALRFYGWELQKDDGDLIRGVTVKGELV